MATDTTGSTVQGLVSGMKQHLGGGASLMFVQGNPSGIVCPAGQGIGIGGQSGAVIAYDTLADKVFLNDSGTDWLRIGSVDF